MPSMQLLRATVGRPQAIFLDRDGTINRERADYVKSWEEYAWLPGALGALADLAKLDIPIFVITNQSAVGRGILDARALAAIHARVQAQAATAGGRLDAFFVCPHAPADHCNCRKPQPGLLLAAAQQYNLDLSRCVFVGDSLTDMQAAEAAGCAWLLVRTGRQGTQLDAMVVSSHDESFLAWVIDDLAAAVAVIAAATADHLHFETSFE